MERSGIRIESLLEECIKRDASDLHIQVGLPPILRIDGELVKISSVPVLRPEDVEMLIFSTLDEAQRKILIRDKEFDYSFAFGELGRFRANAFHERGNLACAFRLIPTKILSVAELGLPAVVESFALFPLFSEEC